MGVLACDRKGCENVMCDHYSDVYGYLCYSCLSELNDSAPRLFNEYGVDFIQKFMDAPKGKYIPELYDYLGTVIEGTFKMRD